ncbi:Toll-like receptor 5 [Sciurus carolinensis]|uniref:Toll-like receptor 5 n=1 Tax=Sciurus carolinensis TaxID=30640 RepID=A0AA41N9N4_SCICA|nr:Toll-like receptor 5 [Sciurus carolinensis]
MAITGNFSNAIRGSQTSSLILTYHIMGSGFGFQNIKDPDENTFSGLDRSSVVCLDLSHGYIFSLNPRLFKTLKELKLLNLACNKINRIADKAYYGLESLQILNISCNLLGELYNSSVAYVDLQKNHFAAQRLLCNDHLQRIEPDRYRYDAYFCFSSKDFEWVQNALLKHLDTQYSDQNRFHLYSKEKYFVSRENHIAIIQAAIWNSRKIICLVSRHFLRDGWCLEAFSYVQSRCLSDLSSVLIMVVVGSLSQYQLMKYQSTRGFIQKQQYLKWPEDVQDVGWVLNKLSQHILKKEKERKEDNRI